MFLPFTADSDGAFVRLGSRKRGEKREFRPREFRRKAR